MRIDATFADLKSKGHMAFMPFVSCGDPDMETTLAIIRVLAARGVDLIEVGFPYSDPIADGPVIQASYARALAAGLHVSDIFEGIASLRNDRLPPLVAMVSYAIIFRSGPEKFLRRARDAGFTGLIVPDLPGDEAGDFATMVQGQNLDLIQLVAPTTPPARVERILRAASGFVYCLSVAGTTGVRDSLQGELKHQLKDLRTKTALPLAVGFGISKPEQVQELRGLADGVIVGSAIVRQLEPLARNEMSRDDVLANIGEFSAQMVAAVHR
ncbi:MAG: tryptophan synthase subunit alpha [Planctomycetaceae bacterium]